MDHLLPGMGPDFVATLAPLLDPDIDVPLGTSVERVENDGPGCAVIFRRHGRF
jgi:hypothetical protein